MSRGAEIAARWIVMSNKAVEGAARAALAAEIDVAIALATAPFRIEFPPGPERRPDPHRMGRREASQYLRERHCINLGVQTLAKLECLGKGPAMTKSGKACIYTPADLDTWVRARTVRGKAHGPTQL